MYPAADYINRVLALSPDSYWATQEFVGPTALDATGNAHTGTIDAQTVVNKAGYYGQAHETTNTGGYTDASAALTADFNPNNFTVSVWLKNNRVAGQECKIMEVWDALSQYFAIELRTDAAAIGLFLREADGDQVVSTGVSVPDGVWTHLVFYNSLATGKMGIYLNGTKYEYDKTSTLGITGALAVENPGFFSLMAGRYQHVAMWNSQLTQANVNTICT